MQLGYRNHRLNGSSSPFKPYVNGNTSFLWESETMTFPSQLYGSDPSTNLHAK